MVGETTLSNTEPTEPGAPRPGRLARWLGDLSAGDRRLLGPGAVVTGACAYTVMPFGLAIPQIQLELGLSDAEISVVVAALGLGVVPALLLSFLADRFGRRRLLLWGFVGLTMSNLMTAGARSGTEIAIAQFLAVMFRVLVEVTIGVLAIEQASARRRGFVVSLLRTIGMTAGGAAALIAFGMVDILPFGWRTLFVVGAAPIVFLPWISTRLREGERFDAHRTEAQQKRLDWSERFESWQILAASHGRRVAAMLIVVLVTGVSFGPAGVFVSKFLQTSRGFSPSEVSLLYFATGIVTPLATILAGRASDRIGRRWVLGAATVVGAFAIALFFHASGVLLALGLAFMSACMSIAGILQSSMAPELVPTAHRSSMTGLRELAWAIGQTAGMTAIVWLQTASGSLESAIVWLLAIAPVAPLLIWWAIPETSGRELEEI